MTKCKLIGYRRVSTAKQGESGLGLEAQDAAINAYAEATGCQLVASFTEVESGKRADRPELLKAIAHARRIKATLVIAKLDRLGRNVAFIANLMESGVSFVACDSPGDDPFMLHIKAAFAEDEARRISTRTKEALAAYKARGGKLGTNNLTMEGRTKAVSVIKNKAVEAYADLLPKMEQWRTEGLSLGRIAGKLNDEGHTTRTGTKWSAVQVMRALSRTKN